MGGSASFSHKNTLQSDRTRYPNGSRSSSLTQRSSIVSKGSQGSELSSASSLPPSSPATDDRYLPRPKRGTATKRAAYFERRDDGESFLWTDTDRRTRIGHLTPGHETIFNNMQLLLLARIISGERAGVCGPWADQDAKTNLDNLIREMWQEVALRCASRNGRVDEDVDRVPSPSEARKVIRYLPIHPRERSLL